MSSKKYLLGPESYREFRETGPRIKKKGCKRATSFVDFFFCPTVHNSPNMVWSRGTDKHITWCVSNSHCLCIQNKATAYVRNVPPLYDRLGCTVYTIRILISWLLNNLLFLNDSENYRTLYADINCLFIAFWAKITFWIEDVIRTTGLVINSTRLWISTEPQNNDYSSFDIIAANLVGQWTGRQNVTRLSDEF